MAGPELGVRGSRVFVALSRHLPLLGEELEFVTFRYSEYGDRRFAAGGVKLMLEPYDLSVVFTLAMHSHDVYVTITEGPIADVASVLCDLDAYSATQSRLGIGATFAPDNPHLLAAGYEGVAVLDLGFWKVFEDLETDLMIGEEDCLHLRACLFITKEERAVRLARDFDAMCDHFVETEKDYCAWPARAAS